MNLEQDGEKIVSNIKHSTWFPFSTGKLKYEATSGRMVDRNTYRIRFDGTVAPYIQCLEEGTKPHDIPGAFGKPLPFGVGGKFDGKFHPGSVKHKGFISDKSVNAVLNYFKNKYGGVVR